MHILIQVHTLSWHGRWTVQHHTLSNGPRGLHSHSSPTDAGAHLSMAPNTAGKRGQALSNVPCSSPTRHRTQEMMQAGVLSRRTGLHHFDTAQRTEHSTPVGRASQQHRGSTIYEQHDHTRPQCGTHKLLWADQNRAPSAKMHRRYTITAQPNPTQC